MSVANELKELERRVENLPPEDLARFREWFLEYEARLWDRQIEHDVAAGRLDGMVAEAIEEHRAGRTKPI